MNTYTTRTDAIAAEIIAPIAASHAVIDAEAEFDIDAIADAVLGDYEHGYASRADHDEFWAVVAAHARTVYEVDMTDEQVFHLGEDEYVALNVIVPGAEDSDMAVIDGTTVVTSVAVPASDQWQPQLYQAALAEAGWTAVGQIPESYTATLRVVRTTR